MTGAEYEKLKDEQLVRMARNGDSLAQDTLLIRYKPVVRNQAKAYFMQGADNDDVVQEGMIGLFKAIRAYETGKGAAFASFASSCVVNQIINAAKTAATKKNLPLNESSSLNSTVDGDSERTLLDVVGERERAGSESDPQEAFLYKEKIERLTLIARERLSSMEQRVLLLLLSGDDIAEIAQKTERPKKSVSNAVTRIRQKLKDFE